MTSRSGVRWLAGQADHRLRRRQGRPRGRDPARVQGWRRGRLEPRRPARRLHRRLLHGHPRRHRRPARDPDREPGRRRRRRRDTAGRTGASASPRSSSTSSSRPIRSSSTRPSRPRARPSSGASWPVRWISLCVSTSRSGRQRPWSVSRERRAPICIVLVHAARPARERARDVRAAGRGDRRGRRPARRDRPRPCRAGDEDPRRHCARERRRAHGGASPRPCTSSTGSRS